LVAIDGRPTLIGQNLCQVELAGSQLGWDKATLSHTRTGVGLNKIELAVVEKEIAAGDATAAERAVSGQGC